MNLSYEQVFFSNECPARFREASLENLGKQSPLLVEFGKKWAKNPDSLLLYGGVGSGKTHYAYALIREYIRNNPDKWPRIYTSPSLDAELYEALIDKKSDTFLIDKISKNDLLIIDDFGRETKSERINRQYFEIINTRYAENLPTIITTNYDLPWIAQYLSEAISSRFETYQFVRFTGKDLRKQELVV